MSSHGPNLGKARLTLGLVSTDRPCMIHEEQHNKLRGLSTGTTGTIPDLHSLINSRVQIF